MFSSRWSENAPVKSPTTHGGANYGKENSNVFNRHLVQKMLIVQCIFFSLSLSLLGVSNKNLTQVKQESEALIGAYDRAPFQKNVKNVKDFRCYVKAIGYNSEYSKWSTLLQQRPESAIYFSDGNRQPNVTLRHGINSKHLNKPTFFNKLTNIFK